AAAQQQKQEQSQENARGQRRLLWEAAASTDTTDTATDVTERQSFGCIRSVCGILAEDQATMSGSHKRNSFPRRHPGQLAAGGRDRQSALDAHCARNPAVE